MKFENWLSEQEHRQDPIGSLARVIGTKNVEHKATNRKPDEHKTWTDVIISMGEPDHIFAFNDAWQEFQTVKQDADDIIPA